MSVSRSLTFLGTPWSVAAVARGRACTAGFCFVAWRRSGYRPSMGLLELLAAGAGRHGRRLAQSARMDRGVPPRGEAGDRRALGRLGQHGHARRRRAPTSRRARADHAARGDRRAGRSRVVEQAAGADERGAPGRSPSPRPGHGTDLNDPLARASEKIANLRGIVLASDGDWNEGPPPVQAAARLRMRGVPIFAVPVGSRTRLPDVELLSLDVPTFGVAGKAVRIPFSIDSSLPRDYHHLGDLALVRRRRGLEGSADRRHEPHQRLRWSGSPRRPATSRCRSRFPSTATRPCPTTTS